MNNFIFENKTKVYFGKGGVKEYLGSLLGNYGETVMLAYGGGSIKRNGVYDEIMGILNAAGKRVVEFDRIMPNPTYAKAQEGAKLARENHVDLILAVGGGSVSDCCKVISAQAKLDEDIWELENTKHTFPTEFIPLGTIVTVFGTGSEMNNGAVITHEGKKIKGALWGAQAEFAFLDPSYTLSVPMKQVISGAFDTLSHAMETYFGKGGLHHAHYPGRVANRMDLLKWTSRAAAPVFAIMLCGSNSTRAAASQSQIPCADGKARQRIHVTLRKPTKPRKEIAMMQPTPNETRTHTDELVDIREVSVDKNLPKEERIAAFIRQIKNPYRFRCGDFVVNACFAGNGVTLEECLQGILR